MARRKRRRRRGAAATAVAAAGSRPGRPTALSRISTSELQAEIERRQSEARALQGQRESILRQLAEMDRIIADLGGSARRGPGRHRRRRGRPAGSLNKVAAAAPASAGNGRRRRGGRTSLADALHSALQGKTLSVSDAVDAVKQGGYQSSSPNLRTMVNQQLLANPNRFRRVARGQYTAR